MMKRCDDDEAWNALGHFWDVGPKTTCSSSAEQNAWSFFGKSWDDYVGYDDRAGLLARSAIDYCLLKETDDVSIDLSKTFGVFGRFGGGQGVTIYESDPRPTNRHLKGYRDLYIYLFGVRAPLNRQYFETWFPRTDYPITRQIELKLPTGDPFAQHPLGFEIPKGYKLWPGTAIVGAHSDFLLARAVNGHKQTQIIIPVIGQLFRIDLTNTEAQSQFTEPLQMWDWLTFNSSIDVLLGKGAPSPLGSYSSTGFPKPWVGRWQLSVPYVHIDYTKGHSEKGIPQYVRWSTGEDFRAAGTFDSGGVVSALTGGVIPEWVANLITLMEIKIGAGVDFRPSSWLSLSNHVRPPPVPLQDPDVPAVSVGDTTFDYTDVIGQAEYRIGAHLTVNLTLNLLFVHPSWTWSVVDVALTSHDDEITIAGSIGRLKRTERKNGEQFDYQQIGLHRTGTYHYEDDAEDWIEACLALPAESEPPAPLEPPVRTADLPTAPVPCLVEARCRGEAPYFRICICDNAAGSNPRGCRDSTLLSDQQMDLLVETLEREGPVCSG